MQPGLSRLDTCTIAILKVVTALPNAEFKNKRQKQEKGGLEQKIESNSKEHVLNICRSGGKNFAEMLQFGDDIVVIHAHKFKK